MRLTCILSALGNETRLRMLNLLSKQELCVCIIEEVLCISQTNASKHLNKLRDTGIINCRRIAQWCFYSINENFKLRFELLLSFLQREWKNDPLYAEDMCKLEHLLRYNDCCKRLIESLTD